MSLSPVTRYATEQKKFQKLFRVTALQLVTMASKRYYQLKFQPRPLISTHYLADKSTRKGIFSHYLLTQLLL